MSVLSLSRTSCFFAALKPGFIEKLEKPVDQHREKVETFINDFARKKGGALFDGRKIKKEITTCRRARNTIYTGIALAAFSFIALHVALFIPSFITITICYTLTATSLIVGSIGFKILNSSIRKIQFQFFDNPLVEQIKSLLERVFSNNKLHRVDPFITQAFNNKELKTWIQIGIQFSMQQVRPTMDKLRHVKAILGHIQVRMVTDKPITEHELLTFFNDLAAAISGNTIVSVDPETGRRSLSTYFLT
tara:strand:+ start:139 stop:882 length:744 start_codon:yes stop_codon:yes gene_type:complete